MAPELGSKLMETRATVPSAPSTPARPAPGPSTAPIAHPPETLEGWYVLHQIYSGVGAFQQQRVDATHAATHSLPTPADSQGWSAAVRLIGSRSDLMVLHLRPTLDGIGEAQRAVARTGMTDGLHLDYSFLSITEAGLYHLTAQLAREAAQRGGSVGDDVYTRDLTERAAAERESAHVKRRLYPTIPEDMPYVCFYPMNKKRDAGQNWYMLSLDERSRLMWSHGMTGRRYAGKVVQLISGAIGFDAWEWGVTLFARDPLDFKKIVTEMRFDEVSARYAEFGDFYVGRLLSSDDLSSLLEKGETGETGETR
jgi:peroxiredoxin